MIPKILHFIWFQGWENLPPEFQPNVDSVKKNNPDYQVMTWDGAALRNAVVQINPDWGAMFDDFKYMHQKIDFGRYAVLYLNGGISVDIDAVAYKGFDQTPGIDTASFIVSKNSTNQFVNNAIILVSKNNPLMLQLLEQVQGTCSIAEPKFVCIQHTTGPEMFSAFVNQNASEISILPNTYFEPCSGANKFCKVPQTAIVDHKHAATWIHPVIKNANKFRYWCRNYRQDLLFVMGVLLLGVFIGYVISPTKK